MPAVPRRLVLWLADNWPTGFLLFAVALLYPQLAGRSDADVAARIDQLLVVVFGAVLLFCVVAVAVPQRWYDARKSGRAAPRSLSRIVEASLYLALVTIGFAVLIVLELAQTWIDASSQTARLAMALAVLGIVMAAFVLFAYEEWRETDADEKGGRRD